MELCVRGGFMHVSVYVVVCQGWVCVSVLTVCSCVSVGSSHICQGYMCVTVCMFVLLY